MPGALTAGSRTPTCKVKQYKDTTLIGAETTGAGTAITVTAGACTGVVVD